jgi:hypothetical protein
VGPGADIGAVLKKTISNPTGNQNPLVKYLIHTSILPEVLSLLIFYGFVLKSKYQFGEIRKY